MSKKLNSLYDKNLSECINLSSDEIIQKYELNDKELEMIKYLYNKQIDEDDIVEEFRYVWSKIEATKTWRSLKKKGLVYCVEETIYDNDGNEIGVEYMYDYGTEIKV